MMQRTSEGKVGSERVTDEVGLALVFDEEGKERGRRRVGNKR